MTKSDNVAQPRRTWQMRQTVLARIAAGESLVRISHDRDMPSRYQVYQWIWSDPEFAAAYRDARGGGRKTLAEQCLEIADAPAKTAVDVADKKLRIETRMRLMGKGREPTETAPARSEPRLDMSQLSDEQLRVLASIPLPAGEGR